ncbi:MAG: SRPBCC family protein [Actinomycetota bacterium]|nr:SRPBCC family protein [Actinomycetota bacterium]
MNCSADDVYAVLGDGWLFGLWVVGTSRIREVDDSWPAIGSGIHHSIGVWPLLLSDSTSVTECRPGRSLSLLVRAWPAGEAKVVIELEPQPGGGCRVTITEDASTGPGRLIPALIRRPMLHWRNIEALRRLSYLAERREAAHPAV